MSGKRHGLRKIPEYRSWDKMKQRCLNPKHKNYRHYGGAGVTICQDWQDSFLAFYRDMGPMPTPRHTVEREDGTKGYSPDNCRWATRAEQARNRRDNILLTFNGKTQVVKDWEKETGIPDNTIINRLRKGWPIDQVLSPVKKPFVGKQNFLTHNGATLSHSEWARKIGINRDTIRERLRNGWSVEMALMKGRVPERGPRRRSA